MINALRILAFLLLAVFLSFIIYSFTIPSTVSVEQEQHIGMPPDSVWTYLAGINNYPQFVEDVQSVDTLYFIGALRGSVFRFNLNGENRLEFKIVDWLPNKLILAVLYSPHAYYENFQLSVELIPAASNSCLIRCRLSYQIKQIIPRVINNYLYVQQQQQYLTNSLTQLKTAM